MSKSSLAVRRGATKGENKQTELMKLRGLPYGAEDCRSSLQCAFSGHNRTVPRPMTEVWNIMGRLPIRTI